MPSLFIVHLAVFLLLAGASPASGQPAELPGTWTVKIVDSPDEAGAMYYCDWTRYKFEVGGAGQYTAKCTDFVHQDNFRVKQLVHWEWRGGALAIQHDTQAFDVCPPLATRPADKAESVTRGCRFFVEGPNSILLWRQEVGPVRRQLLRLERGKSPQQPKKHARARQRRHLEN